MRAIERILAFQSSLFLYLSYLNIGVIEMFSLFEMYKRELSDYDKRPRTEKALTFKTAKHD